MALQKMNGQALEGPAIDTGVFTCGGTGGTVLALPWPADAYNSYWDLIKMFWE